MKPKSKNTPKIIRVPIADEHTAPLEKNGRPWCIKHQDYLGSCPCVSRSQAEEDGFTVLVCNGMLIGEKRVER